MAAEERDSVSVTIEAPAGSVWRALREPTEIERWHGWHYDELEAEIEEIFLADVTEDPERMVLDTNGGGRFELAQVGTGTDGGPAVEDPSGQSERTLLRVVRDLDQYGPDWDGGYDEIDEGWTTFVHQLRFLLERHPGEDRRTLRIDDERPSPAPVWELLKLEALVGQQAPDVGDRYTATLPGAGSAPAEEISGEVWFRTPHQLGLTVEQWDDALLVVGGGADPSGPGSVLVTTFGDDHDAFEARHQAWQDRWFAAPAD